MKMKFLTGTLVLLLIKGMMLTASAQDSTACRMAIRKVFKILQNTDGLMKTGFFMDYKTQMCLPKEYGSKCGEDSAQLIMKGKKYALISGPKKIFHDDSTQVVILDDRKQIMITVSRVINKEKMPQMNLPGIQDSLLFTSRFIDCKFEMIGRDSCFSATLELSKMIQKQTGVEKVFYLVDKTQGVMKKIELKYIDGKQYATATFDIKKVEYKYGKEPFSGTAFQKVLDEQGHLLKAFESYRLIDRRNSGADSHLPKENKANTHNQ